MRAAAKALGVVMRSVLFALALHEGLGQLVLVLFGFFVFILRRVLIGGGTAPDEAGIAGESEERGQSKNDREHKPVKSEDRRTKHHSRRAQHGIARDAAKP